MAKAITENKVRDRALGCLLGGAIGDALGYPVEFLPADEITARYGPSGITGYKLDRTTGKALISDDTQMTLFTADGILLSRTGLCGGSPVACAALAYQDWLTTQETCFPTGRGAERPDGVSRLLEVPALYICRAPGNTCTSALRAARRQGDDGNYICNPRNNSKGCGGIMRVAPLALCPAGLPIGELDEQGAMLSAITHGHPLGYLPSAVLVHILHRLIYGGGQRDTLRGIILEARDVVCAHFRGTAHLDELRTVIDLALALAENGESDRANIPQLGEGWVAEETLAIALYCALRYERDFSGGVVAAVNHDGDSDSTGAVAGNILGAVCGCGAIEGRWKKDLELRDLILEMADELCCGGSAPRR